MWRSLIHLDLSFVEVDKNALICFLLHANCQLSQHHLLKMLSFPLDGLAPFSKIMWPYVCGFISGSSILFLWSIFLSLYKYLELFFFFFFFFFCYYRWICNLVFLNDEELSWNFDGDYIEFVDCFWQDVHFYYINPANSWSWENFFPSSEIFDFFLKRLEVLLIQIFHFFS